MTWLQHFAGVALQGIIVKEGCRKGIEYEAIEIAYKMCDAINVKPHKTRYINE